MTITHRQAQVIIEYIRILRDELPAGVEPLNEVPAANIEDLVDLLSKLERLAHYAG